MKTLYVDIDEQITDVLNKVSALKGKLILLVIPKSATIFKNPVNLKLLRQRAEEEEKELQIFTNDEKAQKMIKSVGLKLYQGHLRKRAQAKAAHIKNLPNKDVKRQASKRVSITEISEKSRKKAVNTSLSSPKKRRKRKDQHEWVQFFLFNTLKKKTVMGFAIVSVIFFAIVLYVAIPSATIYLTPASNVLEAAVNATFANPQDEPDLFRNPDAHSIPSYPIQLTFEKSLLYEPTGKVFTGKSARCNIKIYNNRTSPWTLVPRTRFKDNSGVVFRIREDVQVPAARFQVVRDEEGNPVNEKIPGTLIVSVVADELDENENIIGAKGNLPAETRFFLPGLSTFNQTLLYGENESPCVGGVTSFYTVVTPEDLEAAREKISQELEADARQYLLDYVEGENVKRAEQEENLQTTVTKLRLFDNPAAINYELLETSVPPDIEGEKAEEFSVSGKIQVSGFAYEEQQLHELMEQGLLARVHPEKVLTRIDFDSATQNIVYSDSNLNDLSKVKISVVVRGVEEYNFDPHSEQGEEVIARILHYVTGKPSVDAHYFIANLEQIQKAHISIWPFWKNELPTRESSITIKVQ